MKKYLKKIIIFLVILFVVGLNFFAKDSILNYCINNSDVLYRSYTRGGIVTSTTIHSNGLVVERLNNTRNVKKILPKYKLDKLKELIAKCEDENVTSSFVGANGGVSSVYRDGKEILLYNSCPPGFAKDESGVHFAANEYYNEGKYAIELKNYIYELLK